MPVLLRPDGAVQVGWDPRRAVLVRPPSGMSPGGLASVLRALSSPLTRAEVGRLAGVSGFDALLDGLVSAGVVRASGPAVAGRSLSIRVHGAGPLSDLLADGLRCSGARISRSGVAGGAAAGVDLVVLADSLAPDPRLVRELQSGGVPHLPVLMRDGTGLVGPLVIPGRSSCLCCVDLHRTDRDPAWPALAAQLRTVVGTADRAAVLATSALALSQLQQIISAVQGRAVEPPAPATMNATLEVDVGSQSIVARRWPRHPLCGCWNSSLTRTPDKG